MQQTYYDFTAFELLVNKNPLLVCDSAFDLFGMALPRECVRFSAFTSNPLYEDIKAGVEVFRKNNCDFIVAIGGGSSIDTAKGIKYHSQECIPIMAVPTTAGTGSEATHFAAIYIDGEKHSIAVEILLPDYVVLLPHLLKTLPVYQKKCTMLDALCQAIESWWSKSATPKSIEYSREAIKLILVNMESYLRNEDDSNNKMLIASNLAGKAIEITTTTAPHAMSYKMTTLYGLPHGHAVALCLPKVWRYMKGFDDIAAALGGHNYDDGAAIFEELLVDLGISPPENVQDSDLSILTDSVNLQRLHNNPVRLGMDTIRDLYTQILVVH